jgi:hypothetical protein
LPILALAGDSRSARYALQGALSRQLARIF